MDLRQLRYFVGIADAGSITAAAERLHVAQSALSQHVKRLEERFGVALFTRGPTGVRPTAAGSKLLERARAILAGAAAIETDMRALRHEPCGEVTIAVPPGVGRVLNSPLLEEARERLPAVSLHLIEVLPDLIPEWLAEGSIDLGIVYDLGTHGMREGMLAQEELYLVSGIDRAECEHGVTLDGLAQIPLVMPICIRDPKHCIASYAAERGVTLRIDHRVDSLGTILDLVINQSKAAILSPGAFLEEWRAGRLFAYALLPALRRSVTLRPARSNDINPIRHAVEQLIVEISRSLHSSGAWPQSIDQHSRSVA